MKCKKCGKELNGLVDYAYHICKINTIDDLTTSPNIDRLYIAGYDPYNDDSESFMALFVESMTAFKERSVRQKFQDVQPYIESLKKRDAFKCHGCGACCMAVGAVLSMDLSGHSDEFRDLIESFPYQADKDGHCEKFKDMKCTVYDDRPPLCRVDDHYYNTYNYVKTPKAQYNKETEVSCRRLMKDQLCMSRKQIDKVYEDFILSGD